MSSLPKLPIEAIKAEFCHTISQHNTVILSAPPGAGKSTCLPLWLLNLTEFTEQKIYLLQPRRLAVKNIASYLASQLNEPVGETVGYRLRNETKISKNTRLEVITEGILTQIIQHNVELDDCALVVFDEFHERSLHGDLAFALTRDVQQGLREDLKILLMSATLDVDYLTKALPDAKMLSSAGRSYEVEFSYQAPSTMQRWRDHAIKVIKQQAISHQGSILVFLPGVSDIRFINQALIEVCPADLLLCPLFGELSLSAQQQAIQPCGAGKRKLVLATNIAETSLTIEGVNMVIDCGLAKVAIYDSASLMNKLSQQQIAKASAVQRAGRAGRLMAGHCIRLYAKDDFERRPEQSSNDIQQADLLPTLIEAARWGVTRLADIPLLELPTNTREQQGWQELQRLQVVDKQNKLTRHGRLVAQLPCHPRFANMLLQAKTMSEPLAVLACILTALLEARDILPAKHHHYDCNLNRRVDKLIAHWHKPHGTLAPIIKQVKVLVKSLRLPQQSVLNALNDLPTNSTGLLLAFAYPERIARVRKVAGEFICENGKGVSIDSQDPLATEDYVVIADLMQVRGALRVRLAAPVELSQLEQAFSADINEQEHALFDENSGKILVRAKTKLGRLTLFEKNSTTAVDQAMIAAMWCELITRKGLAFLTWQSQDSALKARWQWLSRYCPEFNLPEISNTWLLANLSVWFSPFVGEIKSLAKLKKLDLSAMLMALLDFQQQQILKQAAPSHYLGPTGRRCPITYSDEKSPKVSVPMQEVYGLHTTPVVGVVTAPAANTHSGIPLILELLSPAKRPIQVTQDLTLFWQGSYKAVQKEMKSNYPKHYWPDDPANAQPTNKTKRHIKQQ